MSPAGYQNIYGSYSAEVWSNLWSIPVTSYTTSNFTLAGIVINLKPDVFVSGNGTADDPWRVVLD